MKGLWTLVASRWIELQFNSLPCWLHKRDWKVATRSIQNLSRSFRFTSSCWCFSSSVQPTQFL